MQMPFLRRLLPDVPIVPMLMGFQRRQTILDLAAGAGARRSRIAGRPARREHRSFRTISMRTTAAAYDGACQRARRRVRPDGLLGSLRGAIGTRARTLRRVRRRSGDRGDAGGARTGRDARRASCNARTRARSPATTAPSSGYLAAAIGRPVPVTDPRRHDAAPDGCASAARCSISRAPQSRTRRWRGAAPPDRAGRSRSRTPPARS